MPKQNIIWIVAILAAAAVAVWLTRQGPITLGDPSPDDMKAVRQAYRLITEQSLERVADVDLQRRAIEGMVKRLDRFSSYVPPELVESFLDHVDGGRETGLGLRFEAIDRGVFVTTAIVDSPAHQAGVAVGDQLVAVDGRELAGLSAAQTAALLKGAAETPVSLVVRSVDGFVRTLTLVRREFGLTSVTGLSRGPGGPWRYVLDRPGGLAYVRVREFLKDTHSRLAAVLEEETKDARGLVLDLRDNPGGTLEAAADTADLFLESGLIVRTVDRAGQSQRIVAHKLGTVRGIPMAVLVNERTASAAEIVAGALQANGRAVLVGSPTLGKNCVQTMFQLPQGLGYLNLTTKRFFVDEGPEAPWPTSRSEAPWQIAPHVPVTPGPKAGELARLRAAAEAPSAGSRPTTMPADEVARDVLELDPVLAAARQILLQPGRVGQILEQARAERAARQAPPRDARPNP